MDVTAIRPTRFLESYLPRTPAFPSEPRGARPDVTVDEAPCESTVTSLPSERARQRHCAKDNARGRSGRGPLDRRSRRGSRRTPGRTRRSRPTSPPGPRSRRGTSEIRSLLAFLEISNSVKLVTPLERRFPRVRGRWLGCGLNPPSPERGTREREGGCRSPRERSAATCPGQALRHSPEPLVRDRASRPGRGCGRCRRPSARGAGTPSRVDRAFLTPP